MVNSAKEQFYTKNCRLSSCGKKFNTKRKWQVFCCNEHRKEYWRLYQLSEHEMKQEIVRLKEEQKKIKERLGIE